jgi:hypothetical protein
LTPCTPYLALIAFAGCFEPGAVFAGFQRRHISAASAPHAMHVVFAAQQKCVFVCCRAKRAAWRVINTHFCTMVCSLGISTILPQQKATLAENQARLTLSASCCALENANCAPGKRRKN